MTEHPDLTYCPVCRACLPMCRWTGARFVTLCCLVEPVKLEELPNA